MNTDDTLFSGRLVAVVAVAMILLVGVLGLAAVALNDSDDQSEPQIVVDHSVVREWKRTLAPGLEDLNRLGSLPGLEDQGRAHVFPCSVDSGDLLDLAAGRSWKALVPGKDAGHVNPSVTRETARGYGAIIRRLVDAGWVVARRATNLGMELPTGLDFDTVDLERDVDGASLRMFIQVFDDSVYAGLSFDGARKACRRAR